MRVNNLFTIFLFFVPILYFSNIEAETAPIPAQMLINIYQEPSPMKADDKYFLVYEIYLTNFMKDVSQLTFFQITDEHKKTLITLENIKNAITSRNIKNNENAFTFNPGEMKTLFIWIPLNNKNDIPKKLMH